MRYRTLTQLQTLLFTHVWFVVYIKERIQEDRPTPTKRVIQLYHRSTRWNAVHRGAIDIVIARHNNSCRDVSLISVTQLLENVCGSHDECGTTNVNLVTCQVAWGTLGERLCVCGRSTAATVDAFGQLGQFITGSIHHIGTTGRTRVSR